MGAAVAIDKVLIQGDVGVDINDHVHSRNLLLYQDNELDSRDAEKVKAHLAECRTCLERYQKIEQAFDVVRVVLKSKFEAGKLEDGFAEEVPEDVEYEGGGVDPEVQEGSLLEADGHLGTRTLVLHLNRRLERGDILELTGHLVSCDACRKLYALVEEIAVVLRDLKNPEQPGGAD